MALSLLCCFSIAQAQQRVSGIVTDADSGESLIGASILVEGTSTGTITDIDGSYTITIPEGGSNLQFSYTGYATVTETINGRSQIDVQLSAGSVLDEVVVIGYGSVKKDDLTGSVNTVEARTFNQGAIVAPTNLIAGKVAGVQVQNDSGEPGGGVTVRIRGGTSVTASNNPLYVVDGIPLPDNGGGVAGGRNPLNFLNPSDIESMTVLKDASAAAIYGSRGANGVIIITTKKGVAGAPQITYDGNFTVSNVIAGTQQSLTADQFRDVVTFAAPDRIERLGTNSTDWFDQATQTGFGTQHNLSIGGGSESSTYRASMGYQQLEGVLIGAETERINLALNFTQSMFNDKLRIGLNLKGVSTNNDYDNGVVGETRRFDPTQPIFDPGNNTFAGFFEYNQALAPRNPVSTIEQIQNGGSAYRGIGNLDLEYNFDDLIPGLSYKVVLGFDVEDGQSERFVPRTYANELVSGFDGEFEIKNGRRTSKLFDTYLTYDFSVGSNQFKLQAGYSYQDFDQFYPEYIGRNLETDAFGPFNPGIADELIVRSTIIENRLISFFGRLNWNINEKYLITASLRRDGSSRFGEENRWGLFPSAAFAWRVLEESWASGLTGAFTDLKLRVGYGVTGNQDFDDYLYLPIYQFGDQRVRYQFGDEFISTVRANAYDAGLKWEETTSWNIGLDFGFLNNRLTGILEFYQKDTEDLLFSINVPAGTNLSDRVTTNIGALRNRGVELTLNAVAIDQPDLGLNFTGNISFNDNEVRQLDGAGSADVLTGGISGGVGNNVQILRVGEAVNAFYLYEHIIGDDGRPLADGIDHNEDGAINLADIYVDQNNDGMVNDQDRRVAEQPAPRAVLGLTTNLTYKNFDFSFTFRGVLGNFNYNNNSSVRGYFRAITEGGQWLNNLHPSATFTRFSGPQYFSDYYLENASFLRLDNVRIGYNFGAIAGGAMNLNVYAIGQNLFTLTNYSGLDPEVGNGIDNAPFPRARIFTVGLRLGL